MAEKKPGLFEMPSPIATLPTQWRRPFAKIPEYNVIGTSNGQVYVAAFPTDVQFDEGDKKS